MSKNDSTTPARNTRRRKTGPQPDIGDEIRRLQKTAVVVRCMQVAACEETEVDWDDAFRVVCDLLDLSLDGLDRLELVVSTEGGHNVRQ